MGDTPKPPQLQPALAKSTNEIGLGQATKKAAIMATSFVSNLLVMNSCEVVRTEGVEPPTFWFVARCSIQLS